MADSNKHSITLKVAGKEYSLVATQESEHYLRLAAETINTALDGYDRRYPNQTQMDKLVLVALSETVSKLVIKRNYDRSSESVSRLERELHSYLDKTGTNR